MAPQAVPEELDVFTVPHSRMKELVNDYFKMVQTTNFNNRVDVEQLLESLYKTFHEFKTHEAIENKIIMRKLKSRMKKKRVANPAICNCHKDSRLIEMIEMVRDGRLKKTDQDRQNYGTQLKEALEDFTDNFIPHMKEEEEVFQPLLQQYLSYEELCEMRQKVLHHHIVQKQVLDEVALEKWDSHSLLGHLREIATSSESDDDDLRDLCEKLAAEKTRQEREACAIQSLPPEILLQIFSFLSPQDLGRCAQVCSGWQDTALDPQLWPSVLPVQWAQGDWSFEDHHTDDDSQEEDRGGGTEKPYIVMDEDADVDETEDPDMYSDTIRQTWREANMLTGITNHLLPRVGAGVKRLVLVNSKALTNTLLKKMVQQCSNVTHLDIAQTKISDAGFKGLGKNGIGSRLSHISLAGCVHISDATLVRLALAYSSLKPPCKNRVAVEKARREAFHGCGGDTTDCLCAAYYETCGQRLNTNCNVDISVTHRYGSDVVGCDNAQPDNGTVVHSSEWDTDVVLDGNCNGERTFIATVSPQQCHDQCHGSGKKTATLHSKFGSIEDCAQGLVVSNTENVSCRKTCKSLGSDVVSPLKHLDLSGCFLISDLGLCALGDSCLFPYLAHLDLSGCMKLTGIGLHRIVDASPAISPESLYYCDNIIGGPFPDTASGCRNLECDARVCCRTGQ